MSVQFEPVWEDGVWKRKPVTPVGWAVRYELKSDTYKVPADAYPENNVDKVFEIEMANAPEAIKHALEHELEQQIIQVFVFPIYDVDELPSEPAEGEEQDDPAPDVQGA